MRHYNTAPVEEVTRSVHVRDRRVPAPKRDGDGGYVLTMQFSATWQEINLDDKVIRKEVGVFCLTD